MRSLLWSLFAVALLDTAPLVAQSLVITNVTVVDVAAGTAQSGRTIVVTGGRIVSVRADGAGSNPAGARILDGRGRFAVPGLWDMHVHLGAGGRGSLTTLIRYGVTAVRDLGGGFDSVAGWRREIRSGSTVGPMILMAGPIVENARWLGTVKGLDVPGMGELLAERIGVATPEEARAAIERIAGMGVEVVKVRNSPPPEAFAALMAAATERGLLTAGHQPSPDVGLAGAVAGKMRSIEHLEGLGELQGLPPARRDSLTRALIESEMWITPTLTASFGRSRSDSLVAARVAGNVPDDSLQPLVTPQLRQFWRDQLAMKKFDAPREYYANAVAGGMAGLRRLTRGGVKLLAGTDLGVLLSYPGWSLHAEVIAMVDSLGMTPAAALRSATLEPARYFRMADSVGTIEPGRRADLILLAGNPLTDVRNIRRVVTVVAAGRVVEPR